MDHIVSNYTILLVTINKLDPNPIFVNINKLKPYRFTKDHILQLILAKLSDFLLKKPVEATHSDNMFTKQPVEITHYNNLFNEKPIGTNLFGNQFIEELVQLNTISLTVENLIERRIDNDLFNLGLSETGINELLKR